MPENKITFGLKNAHYALLTEAAGVITYGTPVKIPGSVSITLDPRGDLDEFYADDVLYYSGENNQGYDGSLEIANIPQTFSTEVLGEELDSTDKVLTEKSSTQTKPFALLFEFDGDLKATRHVMYNCSASRPSIKSGTKTNTKTPNVNSLSFVASPRPTDYAVKTKTTTETTEAVYNAWYTSVYQKTVG